MDGCLLKRLSLLYRCRPLNTEAHAITTAFTPKSIGPKAFQIWGSTVVARRPLSGHRGLRDQEEGFCRAKRGSLECTVLLEKGQNDAARLQETKLFVTW